MFKPNAKARASADVGAVRTLSSLNFVQTWPAYGSGAKESSMLLAIVVCITIVLVTLDIKERPRAETRRRLSKGTL